MFKRANGNGNGHGTEMHGDLGNSEAFDQAVARHQRSSEDLREALHRRKEETPTPVITRRYGDYSELLDAARRVVAVHGRDDCDACAALARLLEHAES